MILICKCVIKDVISDFNLQTSREWSFKWFQGYKWIKNEAWHDFKDQTTKVMNLEVVLRFKRVKNDAKVVFKCKRVQNEDVRDFEV